MARTFHRPRIGKYLVEQGFLSSAELDRALNNQQFAGGSLGTNLLELGLIEEQELLRALGRQLQISVASAADLRDIPSQVIGLIPGNLARTQEVVPFRLHGNTLFVASCRAGDISIENEIALATSRLTRTFIALEVRLQEALHRYYAAPMPLRLANLARRLDRDRGKRTATAEIATNEERPQRPVRIEPEILARSRRSAPRRSLRERDDAGPSLDPNLAPEVAGSPAAPDRAVVEAAAPGETAVEPEAPPSPFEISSTDPGGRRKLEERLLDAFAGEFRRRLLFVLRRDAVAGWRGDGERVVPRRLRELQIPLAQAAPFLALRSGARFWLGPLRPPSLERALLPALGNRLAPDCLVLPIKVANRVAMFVYLDNAPDPIGAVDFDRLFAVTRDAGATLEALIRQRKTASEARSSARPPEPAEATSRRSDGES